MAREPRFISIKTKRINKTISINKVIPKHLKTQFYLDNPELTELNQLELDQSLPIKNDEN